MSKYNLCLLGRSSGTAFVKFASQKEFDAALALDGQLWPGRLKSMRNIQFLSAVIVS